MKKLVYLLIFMMLGSLTSTTLTSCLDNDDDDTIPAITEAEKQARLLLMDGYYNGYVFFMNDSTQKVDSVAIDWVVSAQDSSIHITNFPVRILANGITNVERHTLLENCESTFPLTSVIYFYNHNYEDKDLYTFWNVPKDMKLSFYVTDEQGNNHNVEVKFEQQLTTMDVNGYYSIYSIGQYQKKKIRFYYVISDIIFDNSTYSVNKAIYIDNLS